MNLFMYKYNGNPEVKCLPVVGKFQFEESLWVGCEGDKNSWPYLHLVELDRLFNFGWDLHQHQVLLICQAKNETDILNCIGNWSPKQPLLLSFSRRIS